MNQETKSRARALGEGLAATGVILSLLFVAFQIQQTNAIARVQVSQDLATGMRDVSTAIMESPDLADVMSAVEAGASREDLPPAQRLRAQSFFVSVVRSWESLWLATEEGIVDKRALETVGGYGLVRSNFFRETWPMLRPAHDPRFVEFFEGLDWNH
jgi:hypothetical protein